MGKHDAPERRAVPVMDVIIDRERQGRARGLGAHELEAMVLSTQDAIERCDKFALFLRKM